MVRQTLQVNNDEVKDLLNEKNKVYDKKNIILTANKK